MSFRINTAFKGVGPTLQICDATSGSVRLAWEHQRQAPDISEEDRELMQLCREEATHNLLRRRFLLTTEQYLKGELDAAGQPRTRAR
ncbi:hypothetical protein [Billgrantia endophytica]|uniref:Uncharacterized protein n=1 Tax=Billgrantia endophytica TaxID=2033802 RepID=A0A2N7U9H5_9GAMM|nr:hypothetical protein [Halomonas endophytica]PMR77101.1 hypothetical protein C1H69_03580 [Halomonas endophytica]